MLIQSVSTICLILYRQFLKVNWNNEDISKKLYLEETLKSANEFRCIDSIDEDGMEFDDPICSRHNELHEQGL